jgi:glycosyltransferase involved in cell wall biosynthesis
MRELPAVTVIMPVIDEEQHLADSVTRILDQQYGGELDVVIAVGPSTDRTREVAERLADDSSRVRVVDNPTGRTPAGLNAAIAVATGEVVVRVDGHAMIPTDYVAIAVETLERTGADNVGGIMAAEGVTDFGVAVARAMTSKFGVGGASFHVGGGEGPAPTVYLGTFRRSALERVGGYDESMVRAQDWEMNLRIRETGGVIWFTPHMKVTYRPRASVRALARQYHDYGRWRREVVRRHPDTLSLRYLAAPVAVLATCVGLLLVALGLVLAQGWLLVLGLIPTVGYLAANLLASAVSAFTAPRLPLRSALWLPVVYGTMHFSWGAGFLRGGAGRDS